MRESTDMKFIHLTDTHLVEGGNDLLGTNPQARLQQAVAHICRHQGDAEALVLTGDLTHQGHPDAYRRVRECLAALPMPVYPIPGNHDHRDLFKEHFPDVSCEANGFIQYTRPFADHLGIFLDTHQPGAHWGTFCEARAKWLQAQLVASSQPVLLFMHHPFFKVGIAGMDAISLRDADRFLAAIQGHEARIRHVFFGHIHRPICGTFRGIPFSTIRGTNHQVALELNATNDVDIVLNQEPPQYAVVLLSSQQLTVHMEDYLDQSPRTPVQNNH